MFPSDLHLLSMDMALGTTEWGKVACSRAQDQDGAYCTATGSIHAQVRASYWDCRKKKVAQTFEARVVRARRSSLLSIIISLFFDIQYCSNNNDLGGCFPRKKPLHQFQQLVPVHQFYQVSAPTPI